MSFVNNVRGKRGPPPLPMYQPVVLKHVPTMIRRRYEHFDVNNLDQHQDAPLNDGESEEDGYLDVSDEDELEDMGPGDVSSEPGSRDSEDNDLHDSNPSSEVDVGVSTDDCETGMYGGGVSNEIIQPADLHSEYSSKGDGTNLTKVANHVPVVDSDLEDETVEKRPIELKNEHGDSLGEENGAGDAKTSSYTSLKDGALGAMEVNSVNEEDLPSEYSESGDDGTEVAHYAPIVDGSEDKRLAEFSDVKGFLVGYCKGNVNGAGDAKTANFSRLQDEVLDITEENSVNEQGLHSVDNKGEYDDAEDESPSFCANIISNSEVEEMGHGSLDDKLDALTQMYDEDFSSENIVRNRSLDLEDFKSEGDRTNDMIGTTDLKDSKVKTELQDEAHRSSNTEEFNPDDFKKTVEEDGYELCCPYCKHCITKTLLYHRRENNQHCRITCFTSLFALFCCIRD